MYRQLPMRWLLESRSVCSRRFRSTSRANSAGLLSTPGRVWSTAPRLRHPATTARCNGGAARGSAARTRHVLRAVGGRPESHLFETRHAAHERQETSIHNRGLGNAGSLSHYQDGSTADQLDTRLGPQDTARNHSAIVGRSRHAVRRHCHDRVSTIASSVDIFYRRHAEYLSRIGRLC